MRVSAFLRILAAPAVALVLLLSLFSVSYFGYSNLTSETRIAELSFTQIDTDEYLVNLATGDFCDVRSFAVLGDPEVHIAKLRDLEAAGVTQFNIYLDSGHEEKIIADYGEQIIPAFMA